MNETIKFYLTLFLRRIHIFLLIFVTVAGVSITLAKILPPTYQSSATLLVAPPEIPGQLQAPTVQLAPVEELQIIEQQLMTRANLLDVARRQRVFENIDSMSPDDIVQRMRRATKINVSAGRNQATLMYLTFSAPDGQTAANVVTDYVNLILRNNTETRTTRATNTLEFFKGEVDRLGKLLQEQSARITEFKNANIDALPDTLNYRLSQQTAMQDRLSTVDRQIAALEEQRRSIIDLYNKTGQVGSSGATANQTPEQQRLTQLQDQLRQALAVYSPEHPKVKLLKSQIAQQEKIVANQVALTGRDPNSPTTLLDINLAGIDSQLSLLQDQRAQLEKQLKDLEDSIARTPENTIKLDGLTRDYQNTQQQYNTAVNNLAQASMGERIEVLSKGQRIDVVEPPSVPARPAKPNRLLIAAGGTLFGAFLGVAVIALLEFLNKSIRRPSEITKSLGITPIATIPYTRTPMELVYRRAGFMAVLLVLILGIPALLYTIHTYFMPLDLLYDSIARKIGNYI